jgi:hypothetical protein
MGKKQEGSREDRTQGLVHLGESLHLVVTLSPSVPQDKLREGSLIAREMLRFAQHDKSGKNFRRGAPGT